MYDLKHKTVFNLLWSAADKAGQQVIYMLVYIVLGNILTPEDYGLVGVLLMFIALSGVLMDSGFGSALINKKGATEQDYCSVFYFNTGISLVVYLLLFLSAAWIARLFGDPRLTLLSRVLFLAIPANALCMIQNTQLTKKLDFKSLLQVNLFALILSSALALYLAIDGQGVWALVAQTTGYAVARFIFIFLYNRWIPRKRFRLAPIREFLPYSSKLLGGGLLNVVFNNLYPPLIRLLGFPMTQVGLYTQANKLQEIPSLLITNTFSQVSFPTLVEVKEDEERLKRVLSKNIQTIAFLVLPLMFGLWVTGESLILLILPERWAPTIELFRILCFAGMLTPFLPVLTNLLLAKQQSGSYLRVEILRKAGFILLLIAGASYGITGLAFSWVAYAALSIAIALCYTRRAAGYGLLALLRDCLPYLLASALMVAAIYPLSLFIHARLLLLLSQTLLAILVYLSLMIICKSNLLKEIRQIIKK
jgi:O-antigen/teichoic acid export membrane protein